MKAICIAEEYWANSQLSFIRYAGHAKIDGHVYVIVNKEGKDIFECSVIAEREGRQKAIETGEPCDLLRKDFISFYKVLKRDKFLDVLKAHQHEDDAELKAIYKEVVAKHKEAMKAEKAAQAAERAKREPQLF